jgi:hypothetical protein
MVKCSDCGWTGDCQNDSCPSCCSVYITSDCLGDCSGESGETLSQDEKLLKDCLPLLNSELSYVEHAGVCWGKDPDLMVAANATKKLLKLLATRCKF